MELSEGRIKNNEITKFVFSTLKALSKKSCLLPINLPSLPH